MNLLSYRARSKGELRRRLLDKDWDGDEVDPVLEKLESKGYLNDLEFARMFTRDKINSKKAGPLVIRAELARLQVEKNIVEDVIVEYYPEGKEEELISSLLDKKKVHARQELDMKQQKKIIDFLMRKGFIWNKIKNVLYEREIIG